MDLLKIVFNTLKKNIALFLTLLVLAIAGGVVHYFAQSLSYISNFKTNNGFVDYTLFKSLTDFNQVSSDVYDLPEEEIEEITEVLSKYKVSFVEETTTSISFTAVTKDENADHKILQDFVLKLINHNRFIKNSQLNELEMDKKKLVFLKDKITQLDSLMVNPSANTHISEIPSDSYFLYAQQLDLEEKIALTGKFELIKPVTDLKTNKKPLVLFVALYFILAAFIFVIFSKKENTEA